MTISEKTQKIFEKAAEHQYWKNIKNTHPRYYISGTRDSDQVIDYLIDEMKKEYPKDINWSSPKVMKEISHLIEQKLSAL